MAEALLKAPLSGELFAGVGGLGMAVDAVFGTRPGFFSEYEPPSKKNPRPTQAAATVLAHRYPGVPNLGDVSRIEWSTAPPVRVLSGGFPCQDVSLGGARRGMKEGTRSGLWSEFARAIDELRPDWVVIENVRGLLSAGADSDLEPCPWCVGDDPEQHALRALGAVLGDLAILGFDAEWIGIPASDVGAPHGRFRVFILAWPAAHTDRDGLGGVGRLEPAERDADGRDRAEIDGQLTLLPTPAVVMNDGESAETWLARREQVKARGINGNGMGMPLPIAVQLLPTPGAYDGGRGGSQHPDKRRDGGHSVTIQDVAEHLLPTPVVSRGAVNNRQEPKLEGISALLPTPTVALADGGQSSRSGERQGELLLGGIAAQSTTDWGKYSGAVRRWEAVVGRAAPAPVRSDGRGGKPRLNPELPEWMMGWPAGWVTDPAIGISRSDQLKCAGNGVVPQQAIAALRELLSRPGVPAIDWGLAA